MRKPSLPDSPPPWAATDSFPFGARPPWMMAYSFFPYRCSAVAKAGDSAASVKMRARARMARQGMTVCRRRAGGRSLHQRELQQQRALEHREIVVRHQRQHGLTLGRDVGVDAFHVVDLVAEIGGEQHG